MLRCPGSISCQGLSGIGISIRRSELQFRAVDSRGVCVRISQGKGRYYATESLEPRLLLATVSGTVFDDQDADGRQDFLERGLAGWTVFVDGNNNGALDG